MKVLLVNGSPRKNGCTNAALTEVAVTLKNEGVESEILWLGAEAIQDCVACGGCARSGVCVIRGDVVEASFRAGVDANPARLERLARLVAEQDEFKLDGEEYKRPKGDVGELLNPWYNRKWLGLVCSRDFGGDLLKAGLPEKLADSFGFLMPFYEYFMQLCEPEE